MTSTLLISTYNWPTALDLVLKSILMQSKLPNSITIADDGSKEETKLLIDSYRNKISIPIKHIWQEDNGFEKSKILNKAIKTITEDYIIQIDGDVILHKHFIKDHLKFAKKGIFLFGSRVSINKSFSAKVLNESILIFSWFNKNLLRKNRMLRLPIISFFNKAKSKNSRKLRGCNISYWTTDAKNINGYNQDFKGWGFEDFDFAQRLVNNGVKAKRLKHIAIQFHIYHKTAPKGNTEIGNSIQLETHKSKTKKCKNGINQL